MKNIIEELMKKSSFYDAAARISHFIIHMGNQIDLWYVSHIFEKEDTYYEMCRDACNMIAVIGMDLWEFLRHHKLSETKEDLSDNNSDASILNRLQVCDLTCKLMLTCMRNMFILVDRKLGHDNCVKYGIDPKLSTLNEDALQEFAKRTDINIDKIRDKIINVLGDNSLYGTLTDAVYIVDEEMKQHKSIQTLMNEHEKAQ